MIVSNIATPWNGYWNRFEVILGGVFRFALRNPMDRCKEWGRANLTTGLTMIEFQWLKDWYTNQLDRRIDRVSEGLGDITACCCRQGPYLWCARRHLWQRSRPNHGLIARPCSQSRRFARSGRRYCLPDEAWKVRVQ